MALLKRKRTGDGQWGNPLEKSFRNFFFSVSTDHSSSPTQNAVQNNYFSHLGPHPSDQLLNYTFSSNLAKWSPPPLK
jgi:hypothetical protein